MINIKKTHTLLLVLFMLLVLLFVYSKSKTENSITESTVPTINTTEPATAATDSTQEATKNPSKSTTPPATEPPLTNPPATDPPATGLAATNPPSVTVSAPPSSSSNSSQNLKLLVESFSGRWYLEGYCDIYLDVSYICDSAATESSESMQILSNNFSFRDLDAVSADDGYGYWSDYSLYPMQYNNSEKYPKGFSWCSGQTIFFSRWEQDLSKAKIKMDGMGIYVDTYKFVRTPGEKSQQTELRENDAAPGTEPATKPPITEPATEPPITEPATEQPATEPAATEPSATELPATIPPIAKPPATEPTIGETSATVPLSTQPPVLEPPFIGYGDGLYFERQGESYCVVLGNTDENPTCLVIPETFFGLPVTQIKAKTFKGASFGCDNLKSITIPDSIKTIGENIFNGCASLSTIIYNGTMNDWQLIAKGSLCCIDIPARKIICSDGELNLDGTPAVSYATEPPTVTEPPAAAPVSDVLMIRNTQTIRNQTIYADVYITSTGIVTFENVTVNGNIYCYGQLNCIASAANNVYAYSYNAMISCDAFDGTHGKVSGEIFCDTVIIFDNALDDAFNKWGKQ